MFLWRLFHQLEIVIPFQLIYMEIQCLFFNSLLSVGVLFHRCHFFGMLTINQDPEYQVIFWLISYLFVFFALYCCFRFVVGGA
jgi:hypothetical protein